MKKIILTGLLVLSMSVIGDNAKDVLRKAREDYYKQQKEMAKPAPVKEKKSTKKKMTEEMKAPSEEMTIIEEEVVEEVKPKTPMEKLEYNALKARDKVDFYERVVRSVEREEKELTGYNDVLGKNKKKTVKPIKEKKMNKKK